MGKLLIITGMSGAGKTVALKTFEDLSYYAVDNLPIPLLDKFAELFVGSSELENAALGIDSRNSEDFGLLENIIKKWDEDNFSYEILFLEASDETLIKRFKETRRVHPLSKDIKKGINDERAALSFLRMKAKNIIDTSSFLRSELRNRIENLYFANNQASYFTVNIVSCGSKFGLPQDADLLFDVRFLANPYYEDALRLKTGLDEDVANYVLNDPNSEILLDKLQDLLSFLIPLYQKEGKNQLVVVIACTGGKHRSVTIAKKLYEYLRSSTAYSIMLSHRDINK